MTSIKVKFRPSRIAGKAGIIYYQIIHERKVRQLSTPYSLFPSEWDDRRATLIVPRAGERRQTILAMRENIRIDCERIAKLNRKLEINGLGYSVEDLIGLYNHYVCEHTLFNHMERTADKLRREGRARTAETYRSALSSFRRFRRGEDVVLDCIDAEMMEAYEMWLRRQGLTPNTISFYNRILRAAYHQAVRESIVEDRHPFRQVYTGIDKTAKRALPLSIIKKFKALDLALAPRLNYARDMFMLSFYLRGMSFVDMAYLKKTDLHDGYLTYRRHKTGKRLVIQWTTDMQAILDKYPTNTSPYLLPIIKSSVVDARSAYRNAGYNINRSLKQIADTLSLHFNLTMYVARHSWASAAQAKGIPVSVISEGMGHHTEATTRIYLASLDTSAVDRANAVILNSLK